MKSLFCFHSLAWILLLGLAGCAVKPVLKETETSRVVDSREIEISYVLNKNIYRLSFSSEATGVGAKFELDGQPIKAGPIESKRFDSYWSRINQFLVNGPTAKPSGRLPASTFKGCRSDYFLKTRAGTEIHELHGCRAHEDNSGVGRLIREAEFLLYSHH